MSASAYGGGPPLALAFGFDFPDLYRRDGLARLDARFLEFLAAADGTLAGRLALARARPASLDAKEESALILALAPHLERFLSQLFGIADDLLALAARHDELAPLYSVKRQFVQRRAAATFKPAEAAAFDGAALEAELARRLGGEFSEVAFARAVTGWLAREAEHAEDLDLALRYAAWALFTDAGRERNRAGVLFKQPAKVDPLQLLPHVERTERDGATFFRIAPGHERRREGFALTDPGTDLVGALDQTNYCIWCHNQGKDSCAKGLREKAPAGATTPPPFRKSPFGVTLAGCPLEEKISEFQLLKSEGRPIAALAVIAIDNPLAAATGHRICNDCMKSCIYQKQDPVNIPQAETRTLKDVLGLPWGFEIYSLLTRWNPLNVRQPLPKPASGYRVLVAGMGPAGFALAHYLLNEGHTVVGIDGLKIEPLPESLSGVRADGTRVPFAPVHDVRAIREPLEDRVMAGFGGVAEYGITVRWDKNFLKVVRLLLERREAFTMFGGVRFGSTLTLDDAWQLGFDHVALAMGAGKPTTLDIPNGLARGVRTASDFLMALQLTGAAKADSLANMQLRLPVVVIGGGLTAIDTATESLAYYVVQVEKFLARYESLAAETGEEAVRRAWDDEEREIADEFLGHARAIRAERERAAAAGGAPDVLSLLRRWGGATIAYRRRLLDSPAYTLNHEEVEKALEEGVVFAEGLTPAAVEVDGRKHASGIRFTRQVRGEDGQWRAAGEVRLPARTIFIAAGTTPNTVLAREDSVHFAVDGKYFRAIDEDGNPVKPQFSISKPERADVLLARSDDGRYASFFGDLHPSYFGNVVKAIGSAKQGHPVVSRVLAKRLPRHADADAGFFRRLDDALRARVQEVVRLTPDIVEVIVRAPLAAKHFAPGQFYRLQNYEALAPLVGGTRMQMEGLALTGAWVDKDRGLVSTITLEMGGSSNLVAALAPGEPVVLMGPTGSPTEIEANTTVILVGGGLGNAVLFSIGQAFRAQGSRVLYFAGYKKAIDRYKIEEIERAADVIVWACDEAPGFVPGRAQDRAFVGNIVEAMRAYGSGALGGTAISMAEADRIIAIGSDRMMAAVAAARHGVLAPLLKPHHFAIGSINSPMQCMMKEICAQCLQPHRDPATGETRYVFSCFNQDQPLDRVDFAALAERLRQNSVQEKLTARWIARCMHGLRQQRKVV
ncbi:MAG: FAD-dependent oxidoreductase [Burkholderiales bacterium]|nr:FAD-dependent oxidoreductase [Burkholderiales bacterium]